MRLDSQPSRGALSSVARLSLASAILALILAFTVGCAAIVVAQSTSPPTAPTTPIPAARVSAAGNAFGFHLLKTLEAGRHANVIISPLSLALALAMTQNGAAGATRTAIAQTLGVGAMTDAELNDANHQLQQSLAAADPAVQLEIANALWLQSGFAILPEFVRVNHDSYDADAQNLDFAGDPKGAVAAINDWAKRETHGRIPSILREIDCATRLVLTDAVYFKGRWQRPFHKTETQPKPFHLGSGESPDVPMMRQGGEFHYTENDDFQAIRLPYGNGRLAMYIFLPRKHLLEPTHDKLEEFVKTLDASHWTDWVSKLEGRSEEGTIVLPRFELDHSRMLNGDLSQMGMSIAFDAKQGDFSRMHQPPPNLYIGFVIQKDYMKVDEEGTEAAAVTVGGVIMGTAVGAPTKTFEMVVDHPFFLAIADTQTNALLFVGAITDPRS
jgi:serpin B